MQSPQRSRIILIAFILLALFATPSHPEDCQVAEIERLVNTLTTLQKQGKYLEAISTAREVLELEQKVYGAKSIQVAGTLHWVGQIYEQLGHPSDALPFLKKSYDIYDEALSIISDRVEDPSVLIDAGTLFMRFQEYHKAEKFLSQALEIQEEKYGPDDPKVGEALAYLGRLYATSKNWQKALSLYQKSLDILERAYGSDDPKLSDYLWALAQCYQSLKNFSDALPLMKRILAIKTKTLGEDHPQIGDLLNDLALSYSNTGDFIKAEACYRKALEIVKQHFGINSRMAGTILSNLAMMYERQKRFEKAGEAFEKAFHIHEKLLGPENKEVILDRKYLALFFKSHGDYEKALPLLKESLVIEEKIHGPDSPQLTETLKELAWIYKKLRLFLEAKTYFSRLLKIYEKTLDPNDVRLAMTFYDIGHCYYELGNLLLARTLYEQSRDLTLQSLGSADPFYNVILRSLALVYERTGENQKAEEHLKSALNTSVKTSGPDHPDVAKGLDNLASFNKRQNNYLKAEKHYLEAFKKRKKKYGEKDPRIAQSLKNLANLYADIGEYGKAEDNFRKALLVLDSNTSDLSQIIDIRMGLATLYIDLAEFDLAESQLKWILDAIKKTSDKDLFDPFPVLSELGLLYLKMGGISKAESAYQEALAVAESFYGTEHPSYASALSSMGNFYLKIGDYSKANIAYNGALEIQEKAFGTNSFEYALCLRDHGLVNWHMGNYEKTQIIFQKEILIYERLFGKENFYIADALIYLASLSPFLGQNKKAIEYAKQALEILEKIPPKDNPKIPDAYQALAKAYMRVTNYEQAEHYFAKALAITEKIYGPNHPRTANCMIEWGHLKKDSQNYEQAEQYYTHAVKTMEKAFGKESIQVTNALFYLSVLYHKIGNYEHEKSLLGRIANIQKIIFYDKHPFLSFTNYRFGACYDAMNQTENAFKYFLKSQEIDTEFLCKVMGSIPQEQQIPFLLKNQTRLSTFLMFTAFHYLDNNEKVGRVYDIWLKRKGLSLEAQNRNLRAVFERDDQETVNIFHKLSALRSQISSLLLRGPDDTPPDIYRQKIHLLDKAAEKLESKLVKLSPKFTMQKLEAKVVSDQIMGALPKNSALIDYAATPAGHTFLVKDDEKKKYKGHYYVFILLSNNPNNVKMIILGYADLIDKKISQLRNEISKMGKNTAKLSMELYDLIFRPIRNELGDIKHLFVSPDGNLNLIPFEVLLDENKRFLIEDYTFNYISAGRNLIRFGKTERKNETAILVGDPDFDMTPNQKIPYLSKLNTPPKEPFPSNMRSAKIVSLDFGRLPGTKDELQEIHQILKEVAQSKLYTGQNALEEILKQINQPKILHLATHGFFLEDVKTPQAEVLTSIVNPIMDQDTHQYFSERPMLRSGLVLAGANSISQFDDETMDDGIVTAEEIQGLNLWGTDMVVLSACDTGLGKAQAGEGVFGLRRAFSLAGAKSLIMSMWNVPDTETKELMIAFYKNIVSGKMNRCQALRQAALSQMKIVKERYGHPYPLAWGAFVFVGDPGLRPK